VEGVLLHPRSETLDNFS